MREEEAPLPKDDFRFVYTVIGIISIAFVAFLVWFIYFREPPELSHGKYGFFSVFNAVFNSISAILLMLGFRAIRRRDITRHMRLMLSAAVSSSLFLISYLAHYYVQGDTTFEGTGLVRPVYFFILISHIVLSVPLVPIVLITFYFALTKKFDKHKKIARYTFPIWMYVSVTGVLVFLFLKLFN